MEIELPANGWEPREYQFDAWDYLQSGGRHCELVWHRRGGKDEVSFHWTAVSAHRRIGNYWHMLPQANQARKALWEAVNPRTAKRRVDEVFPPEIRSGQLDNEMLIRLRCGSTWQVVGSDNFNSLVGSPPIGLVFSEWALCDPAAWAYLMPILEENGGWAIFNGTPRGRNHAYRSIREAQSNPEHFGQILRADQTEVFTEQQLSGILRQLIEVYGEDYGRSVYDQEYGCSFDAANLGAILGRALTRAMQEGRISDERGGYDRGGAALEVSGDIGHRDASSWWFWQPTVGGFRVVDHDRDSGLDAEEWCDRLQKRATDRGYKLGKIWLPHDARAKTFAAKRTAAEIFISKFGPQRVGVVPTSSKQDQINAARRIMPRCAFHEVNTERGRDGLASWSFVYDEERREFSKEPDHNWASHDGDGFAYGAQVMEERMPPKESAPPRSIAVAPHGVTTATMNDMWQIHERKLNRKARV